MKRASALALALCALGPARAATADEQVLAPCCEPVQGDSQGYTPPQVAPQALSIHGYLDVGFAKAQGDGTSFKAGDTRVPADYGVDAFAPAVNSRGDAASTDSGGRFTNGFLPRSVGIGGKASFLINTLDLDVRYQPASLPLLVFARAQLLPRLYSDGDSTQVVIDQAFGRVVPFESQELAISVGKFDPVFGIEYLETQANLRTGITPSLVARYTTGTSIGIKAFYRLQVPALWSAVSLNAAATNSSPFVEALQPPDASLIGVPVGTARLGYELDLPKVQLKLGASGMLGPRNDQRDSGVLQRGWGADARLLLYGLSLSGEYVWVREDEGTSPEKVTGAGEQAFASGFAVRGLWAQLAYGFELPSETFRRLTLYGVYSWRHAQFQGYDLIIVDRLTAGLRLDVWDSLALKVEALFNRELAGAPSVPNDVYTSSLVYTW